MNYKTRFEEVNTHRVQQGQERQRKAPSNLFGKSVDRGTSITENKYCRDNKRLWNTMIGHVRKEHNTYKQKDRKSSPVSGNFWMHINFIQKIHTFLVQRGAGKLDYITKKKKINVCLDFSEWIEPRTFFLHYFLCMCVSLFKQINIVIDIVGR